MDLVKSGAMLIGAVVVVIVGMNQYESYKLNSRANNAIDTIKTNMEKSQKERYAITRCAVVSSSIQSSLAIKKTEALIAGTNVSYDASLSSSEFSLFDNVLEYPLTPGIEVGTWSKVGEHSYECILENEQKVKFEYDNLNGKFNCVSNCSKF